MRMSNLCLNSNSILENRLFHVVRTVVSQQVSEVQAGVMALHIKCTKACFQQHLHQHLTGTNAQALNASTLETRLTPKRKSVAACGELLIPKSVIFSSRFLVSSKLSGFRSRCTMGAWLEGRCLC